MAEVTVKQLAQVVGTPVEKLLVQLKDAGVEKTGESDMISDAEKLTLLCLLRDKEPCAVVAHPLVSDHKYEPISGRTCFRCDRRL